MASRESDLSKLIGELFDFTKDFWQVGAVVTIIGTVATIVSLFGVRDILNFDPNTPEYIITALGKFSIFLYLLPGSIGFITIIFARRTLSTYFRNRQTF